jgi:ABC-2 type transport system permease protein
VRILWHEVKAQQRLFWRSRELAFFTFALPLILYVLLASVNRDEEIDGVSGADYLLAGMIGYGAAAIGFGGLSILLVWRRELGILKRLRATPVPARTLIAGLLVAMLVSFAIETVAIVALGAGLFDASMPERPLSLAGLVILGAAAFAALGLGTAGLVKSADAVSPVVNAVYLPMAFLSGSFFSPEAFPELLQRVADVLPLTYYIQLVRGVMVDGEAIWFDPAALAVVAAWGLVGMVVAIRTFGWEPRQR